MKSRMLLASALALFSMSVYAGHHSTPPPKPDPVPVATSQSSSVAGAAALAGAHSSSTAQGGNAQATGGKGVGVGVGGDSSAVVGDTHASADGSNVSTIDASTSYERQVGALVMGTLVPVGCGSGAQAGGADTTGSGILGITWTTDRCYTLMAASMWAAMGQYELACEMLSDVTRRAQKRRTLKVDCAKVGTMLTLAHTPKEPVVMPDPVPVPPCNDCVTMTQMQEYVGKAFKSSVSK